jgi:hypothetical protein
MRMGIIFQKKKDVLTFNVSNSSKAISHSLSVIQLELAQVCILVTCNVVDS